MDGWTEKPVNIKLQPEFTLPLTKLYVRATGGWCGRMFYVATRSALVAQDEMGE